MPALTIDSVDDTTDQLEITGHGLLTGDGAARIRNVGGALPAPLGAGIDYWIIRVDADHIKIATSQAAALAGTAINLSDTGSGTHILEVGLPFTRWTTYAAGSQVKSRDLNSMEDEIIAAYGRVGGDREIWIDAADMSSAGSAATQGMNATTGETSWTFAVGNRVACGVPGLRQGETIKAIKARADSTPSTGALEIKLWKRTSAAAPAQVGSTLTHSNTGSDQTHTLASPELVAAGSSYRLAVACTAGAPVLYELCVVVGRGDD